MEVSRIHPLILYLGRWQLSWPAYFVTIMVLWWIPTWAQIVIANLIGGLIFYHVDKKILCKNKPNEAEPEYIKSLRVGDYTFKDNTLTKG